MYLHDFPWCFMVDKVERSIAWACWKRAYTPACFPSWN
uniref:Uncharacterized protein n=1 Tax=Anguilla anguilla TaxID=7936 RepID=A0A0E9UTA2_ANGAN